MDRASAGQSRLISSASLAPRRACSRSSAALRKPARPTKATPSLRSSTNSRSAFGIPLHQCEAWLAIPCELCGGDHACACGHLQLDHGRILRCKALPRAAQAIFIDDVTKSQQHAVKTPVRAVDVESSHDRLLFKRRVLRYRMRSGTSASRRSLATRCSFTLDRPYSLCMHICIM